MKKTHGRRRLALLLSLAMCLTLASAVFAEGETDPPALTGISIALDRTSLNLVEKGEAETLTAAVSAIPDGAGLTNSRAVTYTWDSSEEKVVKVTGANSDKNTAADNVIKGTAEVQIVGVGTAEITVTAKHSTTGDAVTAKCAVTVEAKMQGVEITPSGPLVLERGGQRELAAATDPPGRTVTWASSDESVATVSRGTVYARNPGETEITASISGTGDNKASGTVKVEVSGIKLEYSSCTLEENESRELPRADRFGVARGKTVNWMSMNPDVAEIIDGRVVGMGPGRTTLKASVDGGVYEASLTVEVEAGLSTIDLTDRKMSVNDTLSFSTLSSRINAQADGKLSHITGLRVDTAQGTLYYRYYSEAEPGAGVAQQGSYYMTPGSGQRGLSDITFVPKASFAGGTVTINYTAVSRSYENRQCRILLSVEGKSGGGAAGMSLFTPYDTPVKLSSAEFDRVCQELNGVGVSTVTFSQPSSRQGVLYTNYVAPGNYGSVVSTSRSYTRQELDDIWFVPAAGFSGRVTISYTARGRGSSGSAYSGSLTIEVGERSAVKEGGPAYTTASGGPVTFDDWDFENYRQQALSGGTTLSYVQFNSLPGAAEGRLYYDYRSATGTGSAVSTGTSYYYGTRTPRLDRITFVPTESFAGTVRIPFTGWDRDGRRFSGEVEIAVRGDSGTGDIRYTCAPGKTVYFKSADFTDLSRELTGRTLSYIRIQSLPSTADGYLYYNNSRLTGTTSTYTSGNIANLSFRAGSSFSGSADIPFVGYSTGNDTFYGTVTVNSSGFTDWSIRYTTRASSAAVFKRADFDDLSNWETDRGINYIRFDVPSTSQGDLYRNYSSSSSKGTRISSNTTSIYADDLSRVAFIPNRSFDGTVYLNFTARSLSGDTFQGTVEVTVNGINTSDRTIRYSTSAGAAAVFQRTDFDDLSQWETNRNINYVRFEIPSTTQGDLYRNYYSATSKGSRLTSSSTSVYGSDLNRVALIPNGSFVGTVYVDFTAVSLSGDTFYGTVEIAVADASTPRPVNFFDVPSGAYYADAVRWAVNNGITNGTGATTFSPDWTCTVSEILTFLYRANGSPRVTGANPFNDVRTSDYYYEAALWAHQKGLVSGSAFNPYAPCTRSMVVTYLWKLAGQPKPAAQPISYAPCTLSGRQEYGNFTLRFDAAVMKKTRITLHHDNDEMGRIDRDFEPAETYDVTLVAVRPGSGYTIDGGFYGFTYASGDLEWINGVPASLYFRASDGSFRHTLTQMGHDSTEFALYGNSLSWFRENGRQESNAGNNGSADCGALIQLNGEYYFVTYSDSAVAAGLLSGSAGFVDVTAGAPYEQAVAWATEQKITTGTSKTTFSPDVICSRGQIVTFLYRAMGR